MVTRPSEAVYLLQAAVVCPAEVDINDFSTFASNLPADAGGVDLSRKPL
jgi:hypothetical protein